jgi:hypothetical protein
MVAIESDDVGLESDSEEATICHQAHITSHSSRNPPFSLTSACTAPDSKVLKRCKEKMSDTHSQVTKDC